MDPLHASAGFDGQASLGIDAVRHAFEHQALAVFNPARICRRALRTPARSASASVVQSPDR